MAFKKNRTTIGILAIIGASVLCFVVAPMYSKGLQKTIEVVTITNKVSKGEKITERDVKTTEVARQGIPTSALLKKDDVIGKYAVVDMVKEDMVLDSKLSKNTLAEDRHLYNLDGSEQVISFTIQNFASGLSGKLQTGDIISIIATSEDENGNEKTYTPEQLQYVEVVAVTDPTGVDKQKDDTTTGDEELPVTITVLVSKLQAELIASLEENSKMHSSLIFRGTEEKSQEFLEKQKRINMLYENESRR